MTRANADIKAMARAHGIYQWEIADFLNMSEVSFCRLLRHELDEKTREAILSAIHAIDEEKNKGVI